MNAIKFLKMFWRLWLQHVGQFVWSVKAQSAVYILKKR